MRFFKRMIEARQNKANRLIAEHLARTEYKHESYDHLLHLINTGKLHTLQK